MDSNPRMVISKYKRPLIILLAYYVLLLCLSYYVRSSNLFDDPIYLTPFVPSTDMYVQVNLILLVFVPVSALIGGLFGGYFLAPIFLLITILPSLIIFDLMKEKRLRFIRSLAEKMGIVDFVDISLEKANRN